MRLDLIEHHCLTRLRMNGHGRANLSRAQEGDILMLDNMLSAHGRNPYTGPRKILVTMGEMFAAEDLQSEATLQFA